jgi:hypothetical protein
LVSEIQAATTNAGTRAQGGLTPDLLTLSHLSPMGWEHINLTGDYHWDTSPTLGPDEFRPLRTNAHDFAAAAIAVGMLITEHPPHRSRRAYFTHRAPTLGI